MTINSDLTTHQYGYGLLHKLHEVQTPTPEINGLGKFFGTSPLNSEAVSWYQGLIGEIEVGKILEPLKNKGYIVIHSVPVGEKGSDIDHVVITPTGLIYVINTKHCNGKDVWAGGYVMVNGHKTDFTRNSLFEASRVVKLFAAKELEVEVHPILVFVHAAKVVTKENAKIKAIKSDELIRYIENEEKKRVKEAKTGFIVPDYVYDADFWSRGHVDKTGEQEELWKWFGNLQSSVKKAQSVKYVWAFTGLAAVLGALAFGFPAILPLLT